MEFSERISALRRAHGYSQEQLAERLGVSRQAVSRWEAGSSMPELAKLVTLCELFEVSLDALVRGRNEPHSTQPAEGHQEVLLQLSKIQHSLKRQNGFEYKSRTQLWGLPLVHIHLSGQSGRQAVAVGPAPGSP